MMKQAIYIALLLAGSMLAGGLHAEEKSTTERLAEAVRQGATIDQAVQALVQQDPEKAAEVMNAAAGLLGQIPYSACDDCHCGSGNVAREYPISDLKDVDPKNWVDEVVNRYIQGKEQLQLPLYSDAQGEHYFYHFKATAEMLAPYLQSDDKTSEEEIAKAMKTLQEKGFTEPVRLYLTASNQEARIFDGRAWIEAAKRLGINEIPLRFAFTDCILCEGRSESAHYSVEEMRRYSELGWTAERFFERMEFVLVDKTKPSQYPFQYHFDAPVDELLSHFSGDPDGEKKRQWMEKLQKGLEAPMDLTLQFWSKSIAFDEDAQAFLAAAKELGMKTVPVRASFQDQITCRSGHKRNSYSALELFPDDRIPLVAERFFRGKRRLILDEMGRHREVAAGYPFGKQFTYNAMTQVEELKKYIRPDQMPTQEQIDNRIKELKENKISEALYVTLEKRKSDKPKDGKPIGEEEEIIEIDNNSVLTILAVSQMGNLADRLPVRFLYIQNAKRVKDLCRDLIQQACTRAGGSSRDCIPPLPPPATPGTPGGVSPS